ncbi:sigma-E factor negative regulatory protein [Stutzerimonas kirkiae]|uniref:RNA polymerase subunit sigma n=1 Tax=Stutzerimonas kirkiae TaxID=2211392 RepID=A0A4Q9RDR6_9GAMM|nr:RseA family anti-sigma factor [Stutzerimonas kirkiae]TBU99856.1 RNA polymerase subunit sigma [Stutzerimonas kirkiae]TBV05213.1 RNA polymerase subunit sigma [Stutzerimonas kirkiae]TBV08115.1 RNA polymerase subunit sigma [Stutzerimonas kirkiae]TBV17572.1 RNA polymerase subunit sigma [Stutzerimonas kirkiae]
MSREALHESLSAVMDNEADELELRRVLAAGGDAVDGGDEEVRSTWLRYQVARAAMHKELLEPRLDIAAAVSAALADEPVHASEAVPAALAAPVQRVRSAWRSVGRLAVAASVTVAVLAGVRLYNQQDVAGPQLAQQAAQPSLSAPVAAQGPTILAGYSEEEGAKVQTVSEVGSANGWHEQRLPTYIRQHAQQAVFGAGAETPVPHAQSASMEER